MYGMKNIQLLLFALAFSIFSNAQTAADLWGGIPQKTDIITVINDLSATENMKTAILNFIDDGYTIQKRDSDFMYFSTDTRSMGSGAIALTIKCKDSAAVVSGVFSTGISIELYGVRAEDTMQKIEKRGQKKSAFWNAFIEMDRCARMIPGKVTYGKPLLKGQK